MNASSLRAGQIKYEGRQLSEISDHHYNVDAPIEEHFGHLNGIKRALTCIKIGSNAFQAESRHQDAVRKVPTLSGEKNDPISND